MVAQPHGDAFESHAGGEQLPDDVLVDRTGSRWRRAEALALQEEGLSITRIAALFRVTRQRVSALVNGQAPSTDGR